jgi:hypothetical protein
MTRIVEKIVNKNKADLLFLIKSKDVKNNKDAWWYLLCKDKNSAIIFSNKIKKEDVNLSDYGKILYSGFGEEPPYKIVKQIEIDYNIAD